MDEVADRIAIQDVMLRYAAGIDERDYELYRTAFADDVEFLDFRPEPIRGVDPWVEFVQGVLVQYRETQHMLGPVWAIIDGDEARVRTDLQAMHCPVERDKPNMWLWGTYKTRMRRTADGWKIAQHRLVTRERREV